MYVVVKKCQNYSHFVIVYVREHKNSFLVLHDQRKKSSNQSFEERSKSRI